MRTFGLVGYPLTHSFSQKYFTNKFHQLGISNAAYINFSIPSINELEDILKAHTNLVGFNVTIPHKKHIIPFLNEQTDAVKQIGACNCVKILDGKLMGYNTDVVGFEQSLKPFLNTYHQKALVFGSGGAAAAVEYVLNKLQIQYKIVSRNPISNQLSYEALNRDWIETHTILINTSPVGQYPSVNEAPAIPYEFIGNQHHLFDLIYNPSETLFLQMGKAQGATIQNGAEMLVLQAEESWRIWNET